MKSVLPLVAQADAPLVRFGRPGLIALGLVAAALLPYLVPSFQLSQVTSGLILGIAVIGLNLLSGFGGQISLGHAAFFGLGAYTAGILTATHQVPPWVAIPVAVVACAVAGGLVALPALRVSGMYLALVTLAVGIIFPSLVRRFESLTGGSAGLFGISFPAPDTDFFAGRTGQTVWTYWVVLAALVLSVLVVYALMSCRVGRSVVALRDNETAAVVMGVNRVWTRTALFAVSAAITGLAGALFAMKNGLITPETFSLLLTIDLLVAMVLGGTGSYLGPVLGGLVLYFAPSWTGDLGGGPIAGVLFGAVVLLLVFVLPTGLAGGARAVRRRVLVIEPAALPRPTPLDHALEPLAPATPGLDPGTATPSSR